MADTVASDKEEDGEGEGGEVIVEGVEGVAIEGDSLWSVSFRVNKVKSDAFFFFFFNSTKSEESIRAKVFIFILIKPPYLLFLVKILDN